MTAPLSARASLEFPFPSEEPRIGPSDGGSGQIDWTQFIIAVSSVLPGDEDVDGLFHAQRSLRAYAPWIRDIGSQVAVQVRKALGFGVEENRKIALHMGVKPVKDNLFRLNVTVTAASMPPGQTTLFDMQDASRRN